MVKKNIWLFLMAFSAFAAAENEREYVCNGISKGVSQRFSVTVNNTDVTKIDFSSLTDNGDTCEIPARVGDGESKWTPFGAGEVTVATFPLEREGPIVRIKQDEGKFYILIRNGFRGCGLKGYLAPQVVLDNNSEKCEFKEWVPSDQ